MSHVIHHRQSNRQRNALRAYGLQRPLATVTLPTRTTHPTLRLYLIRWDASVYVSYRRVNNRKVRFVITVNGYSIMRGSAWERLGAQRAAWQWIAANRAPAPDRKQMGIWSWTF